MRVLGAVSFVLVMASACGRSTERLPVATSAPAAATSSSTAEPSSTSKELGGASEVADSPGKSFAIVGPHAPTAVAGGAVPFAARARNPAAAPIGAGALTGLPASPVAVAAPLGFQGGSVTAGEWDDNANYREFRRWLATEDRLAFHRVDLDGRRFIVVGDERGRPVPGCRVVVADAKGGTTNLVSTSSGRAILFPRAEGLRGDQLTATAGCEEGTATTHFSLDGDDGVVELRLLVPRQLPAARPIDIAFILDTTGSMAEEISAVKNTIHTVATSLRSSNVQVRIGMVEYKDRGDEYVTRVHPMTTDVLGFAERIASLRASGGGDMPESVNAAVHAAVAELDWRGDAVARLAFLIGDAPPHLDYQQDFDYAVDMRNAAHKGIQLFTIAASGMDDLGQAVFRQLAQYTGGTNMFVLRGGAGPQSTGAGDPKSSCGGTQTAYQSGNLDALILGKINRAIAALDGDPTRIAGVHRDENAKPCADRLVIAQ